MRRSRVVSAPSAGHMACVVLMLLAASGLAAQAVAEAARPEQAASELRAAQELDAVRADPLALRDFLKAMPKGADLHNHSDGAVYAETFIRVGGEDGLCVDQAAKAFTKSQPIKSGAEPAPVCEAGDVPAADVPKNQRLYDALVDSFSMRGFVPSEGVTGQTTSSERSRNSVTPILATPAIFSTRSPPARPHRTRNISS